MNRNFFAPLAVLALAACNQNSVSLTNASPEEVAKATKEAGARQKLNPGKWETTMEILDVSMPGAQADVAKAVIENMKGKSAKSSSCMTPEQANDPNSGLLTGNRSSKCTFSKYELSGGKIDAVMSCPDPRASTTMHISGTFQPEQVTVENEVDITGAPGMGSMHQKVRVTARRIGACDGSEKAK